MTEPLGQEREREKKTETEGIYRETPWRRNWKRYGTVATYQRPDLSYILYTLD